MDFDTADGLFCQKLICVCNIVPDHSYAAKRENICHSMASVIEDDESLQLGSNTMNLSSKFEQTNDYSTVPNETCLAYHEKIVGDVSNVEIICDDILT